MDAERPGNKGAGTPRGLSPPAIGAVVVGVTALALGLRLGRLGETALWYDEAFGLLIARMPWGEMNRTIHMDVHPPLWFWLLHLWGTDSVLWARMFGVVLGTATVPLVWFAARRPLGEGTALVAAGVLALWPLHLFYSQELRMYAFLGLLITALIGIALRIERTAGDRAHLWRLGLVGAAVAVMMTQYLGGTVVGGVWLGLLLAWWGRLGRRRLIGWFLSGALALALTLLWIVGSGIDLGLVEGHEPDGLFLTAVTHVVEGTLGLVRTPPWRWMGVSGGGLAWSLISAAMVVSLAVAGAWVMVRDPARRPAGLLLASTIGVGLLLLIAYQLAGLLFFPRFYVVLAVPGALLMASALTVGPRWWRIGGTAVVGLTLLSHAAGVVMANGQVREVTAHLVRWIEVRGGAERLPPVLCEEMFLVFPLRALLPQTDVRVLVKGRPTSAQREILGPAHHAGDVASDEPSGLTPGYGGAMVRSWPEEWGERPIWVALSNWGPMPESRGAMEEEALQMVQGLGAPHGSSRLVQFDAVAGGFKWVALVEVR